MKFTLTFFSLAAALFGQGPVKVDRIPGPPKALLFEVDLPATVDAVWEAFTTSEGLSTWLTPGAVVDLREGGEWTAHFPGGGTGGGTILRFTPKKTLVMSAMAPEKFPHVRAERTTATWEFTAAGPGRTRLTLRQTGWKESEEWDKAYDYLATGNAQLLTTLQRRFQEGPINWEKEWGPAAK